MQTLKQAIKSIRIQALIFTGDESGLRIAEIRVEGNRRVDADAVRSVLRTRVGEALEASKAEVERRFGVRLIREFELW